MFQDQQEAVKMSVTFNMDISRAKSTNINGMNNIVKQVKLSITATDGVNTAVSFFPVDLDYPDKENFIEYEKLSRDQISTWVMNKVGEDQINSLKNGLTSELKDRAVEDPDNPVLTNIQLPN